MHGSGVTGIVKTLRFLTIVENRWENKLFKLSQTAFRSQSWKPDPRVPRPNVKEIKETVGNPYVRTLDSSPRGEPQRVERFSSARFDI